MLRKRYIKLSDYFYKKKEKGEFLLLDLHIDSFSSNFIKLFIRVFFKYFSDNDLIKLNLVGNEDSIKNNIEFQSKELCIFGKKPRIYFNLEAVRNLKHRLNISEIENIKNLNEDELWLKIYSIYNKAFPSRSFYETDSVSYFYQVDKLASKSAESLKFNHPDDYIFYKWMFLKKYKKIFDIGCGAGAFYSLINGRFPYKIKYKGIDFSRTQIMNARRLGSNEIFQLEDASSISADEFSEYDVIHAWSVFAFMPPQKAIITIDNILKSDAKFFGRISTTKLERGFIPSFRYIALKRNTIDNKQIYTPIFFPIVDDILKLVSRHRDKYHYEIEMISSNKNKPLIFSKKEYDSYVLLEDSYTSAFESIINKFYNKFFKRKELKYCALTLIPKDDYNDLKNLRDKYKDFNKQDYFNFLQKPKTDL